MYNAHLTSECDNMAHGRMDHVLLALIASWQEMKLPVHSIQLDDWYGFL
jgi:hypothetical protein